MSTTDIRNTMFLLPIATTDIPLEFSILHKGYDEEENNLGFYSYNEYMSLPGNKAFYTPSGTHALLSENVTSIYLKDDIGAAIEGTPFVLHDGKDMDRWLDADQSMYIWCITTDKRMRFSFDEFRKVSPLYNLVEEDETTI